MAFSVIGMVIGAALAAIMTPILAMVGSGRVKSGHGRFRTR